MAFKRKKDNPEAVSTLAVVEPASATAPTEGFGQILVEQGLIGADALSKALTSQNGARIDQHLLSLGLVSDDAVSWAYARERDLSYVDLTMVKPQPAALATVEAGDALALLFLPLRFDADGVLDVAICDPTDERVFEALRRLPVDRVRVSVAPPSEMRTALVEHFGKLADLSGLARNALSTLPVDTDDLDFDVTQDDAPIVQIVNRIVQQALRERASDVHLEPIEQQLRIRFRIDGALKEVATLPMTLAGPLTSRIKIMAQMNIVERRRPQDGQFRMEIDGRELDVRVSTTATIWGEKTVLRLLDKSKALLRLGDLGMPTETYALYSQMVRSPFGMLVVSGPTGSGKTTTLYATLAEINRPDINIMTVEDPVEYVVPTINQIQINEQSGLSFATGLKSILRQDPDVILVGEMRDVETARIAIQSALTGHFVLSTVHATDTIAALYRVLNMGVEAFAVASSIMGVVAQRLVRRSCTECSESYKPDEADLAFYQLYGGADKERFVRGRGCNHCAGTGYFDRIGVYEVLPITEEIRQVLVASGSPNLLREIAIKQGMRTLREQAMTLVANDVTTIDEVLRTVYVTDGS